MSLAEAGAALLAALTGDRPRIISVEVPPNPTGWMAWWNADLKGAPEAVLCLPPQGRRIWGRGVARALRAPLQEPALNALWHDFQAIGDPAPAPAAFAALPFDAAAPTGPPWEAFGQGGVILPRWSWDEQGGRAWLRLAVLDPASEAAQARAEWQILLESRARPVRPPALPPQADTVDELDWADQIAKVLAGIAGGALKKLVLAREASYTLPSQVTDTAALARLKGSQPGTTVFGLRQRGATFLGATPERLIRRDGREVELDALAGTGPDPEGLLASAKDRWEHRLVVDEIAAALGPRCEQLSWPERPEVIRLRDLCHLRSPFRGLLRGDESALALALALHPTPAVGGVPRATALAMIRALERSPRGLYAGPVGWVDQRGDGALFVALRSGVLQGQRLSLFAGVGVVAGSEATAELAETGRKLAAMEAAFSP